MSGLLFLCCRAAIKRVEPVGSAQLIYIPRHLSRVRPKSPKWSAAVSLRQIKPSGKTKQKQRRRLGSHGRQRGGRGGGGSDLRAPEVNQCSLFLGQRGRGGGKESFIFIEMWTVFLFFCANKCERLKVVVLRCFIPFLIKLLCHSLGTSESKWLRHFVQCEHAIVHKNWKGAGPLPILFFFLWWFFGLQKPD